MKSLPPQKIEEQFEVIKSNFGSLTAWSSFIIPAILALVLCGFTSNGAAPNLIAGISIFAGFLVNAVILSFGLVDKIDYKTDDEYFNYVSDMTSTSIYALYISLFSIVFLCLSSLSISSVFPSVCLLDRCANVDVWLNFVSYFYSIHYYTL